MLTFSKPRCVDSVPVGHLGSAFNTEHGWRFLNTQEDVLANLAQDFQRWGLGRDTFQASCQVFVVL